MALPTQLEQHRIVEDPVQRTQQGVVISPVGEMRYKDRSMVLNDRRIGKVAQEMYNTLVGIQRGDLPDPYGWTVEL